MNSYMFGVVLGALAVPATTVCVAAAPQYALMPNTPSSGATLHNYLLVRQGPARTNCAK